MVRFQWCPEVVVGRLTNNGHKKTHIIDSGQPIKLWLVNDTNFGLS